MDVEFGNGKLDRLETDRNFLMGLPPEVVKAYRRRMQSVRAAKDERDLRAIKGNRLEKLEGKRDHQYSIRLNDQWRLIVELSKGTRATRVNVIGIEDYH
jgi:proteic killer suppression protein